MNTIINPILRGFNPDPSIVRVGDDFYIATSTFEWFPGVQIHHSKDLANWELISRPLDTIDKLDMKGVPDSCGVWAPCLSYHEGTFYLVYSNVKNFDGVWKDTPNYLVTSQDIMGPWSDPVFLGAHGFDGSMYHDEDGRKWYLSMLVDHRRGTFFGGIILQEYSSDKEQLIGPVYEIFKGTELGKTEGPHIYKYNNYYYLVTAEGGTEYGHAVTFARSKNIVGPYEVHPRNPILNCTDFPNHPLQKTGHADLVWTKEGNCYMVCLAARPLSPQGRCILGRETILEEVVWKTDGWPYLKTEDKLPRLEIPAPYKGSLAINNSERIDFSIQALSIHYQSLRVPISKSWCTLKERLGYLRLKGRESLNSTFNQSLLARRVQHFHIEYSCCLEFTPDSFQQMAGIACYYNTSHYFYLHLAGSENGKSIQLLSCDNNQITEMLDAPIEVDFDSMVCLKIKWDRSELTFLWSIDGNAWYQIPETYDASILSDEYVRDGGASYRPAFTGSFVGICCQDLSGRNHPADFKWLHYQEF